MLRLIILILMLSSPAFAQTTEEVKSFVKDTTDKILATKSLSENDKENELIRIFTEVVDYRWMSRFAIGSEWASLDESKQKEYMDSYKEYLLKTYLPKLQGHSESNYKIDGVDDLGDNLFFAKMTVFEQSGQPIKLSYKIKCSESCYIRDLVAEEVSMLLSQRSDFASIMNSKGFEGLISSLNNKSATKK